MCEVIVENIGIVYSGFNKLEATRIYKDYMKQFRHVTLLEDGEISREFFPINELSTVDN